MAIFSDYANTFMTFVECQSVQATAERLNITQPAVTHQLKTFEKEFSLQIFTYSGRRKILTQYGRSIYRTMKLRADQLRIDIESTNRMFFDPAEVTLRIGLRHEVARKVARFIRFPGKVIIEATSGHHALEMLERRELDLVITECLTDRSDIHAKSAFVDRVYALIPKTYFKKRPSLENIRSAEFLQQRPFLAYRENSPFLENMIQGTGVQLTEIPFSLICEDWGVIAATAESGRGWSLVPAGQNVDEEKVYMIEVPPRLISETHFFAYYYPEFLAVPAFKDFLGDMLGEMMKNS